MPSRLLNLDSLIALQRKLSAQVQKLLEDLSHAAPAWGSAAALRGGGERA